MKRKNFLPYCQATLSKAELKEVEKCLKSGWLTMGTKVLEFEKAFANYVGAKHALAVNSCTSALHLSLLAHGIGKGDEVLVPSFTFVASANVIVHAGAKPVFVDIDRTRLTIDPKAIEQKITSKTKAIIVVHYAGIPAEMDKIKKIAKKHQLIIIEDAAHAVGTIYKNKQIGSLGNTTCFSFYATKTITTGEGGMVTTNDDKVADFVVKNRLHGISKDAWKRYLKGGTWQYDVLNAGFKYNMTDIQAAIGIHQLVRLEKFIDKRTILAKMYDEGFKDNLQIEVIKIPAETRHSYHLYPILLHDFDRDAFINKMAEHNIGTSVHFIPIHHFSFYKEKYPQKKGELIATDEVFNKIVSLPLYPNMRKQDIRYVIKTINKLIM